MCKICVKSYFLVVGNIDFFVLVCYYVGVSSF